MPDNIDADAIANHIFESVGVPIIEVQFSFESAVASFNKIIEELPPSGKNQQFKDGVLWADCVQLLKTDNVCLITNDRAFYKDQDTDKGLADNLASEILESAYQFTLLPELGRLLKDIRGQVAVDHKDIASSWRPMLSESVNNLLSNNGFQLGELAKISPRLYATEEPTNLFVEFNAEYTCPSLDQDAQPATLMIGGDCRYNTQSKTTDQFRPKKEELTIPLPDGTETKRNVILAAANVYIGHKSVSHSVRFELDENK